MAYWEIDFSVFAPLTLKKHIVFEAEKGNTDFSFYSKIHLSDKPFGFNATVTASATQKNKAKIAGRVFFESMLNVLSFNIDEPLYIYEEKINLKNPNYLERRIVEESDFKKAFKIARFLERKESAITNALSWYSKALISNNVIDEFLYFYIVLEVLANKYSSENEYTKNGVKNRIYQVFKDYRLLEDNGDMPSWINEMNDIRTDIAHGNKKIDYERILFISSKLALLKEKTRDILKKIMETKQTERENQR
ncbi:methylamine utilization protein MauJ [Lactococcus cremoris]|uniref:Uncharacterized protein n=1 Tax=Lactococcus cremoris subsp. tructae TaxID=542833 RepID=A0A2A5SMY3_LACLC|nr:methylamine utilization protein MauJ [Lactococcus cremoris]PCS14894.1 hypothetical protein RU92_GL001950 [Lactococcus cremoris subsp. tructae]